jgi:predicted DNA-binding transcriptional regulator AlpA
MTSLAPTAPTLTERQAAQFLGIAFSTLRQARMQGPRPNRMPTPPYVRLGRRVLYLRADLERWLASHRILGGGAK